MSNSPRYVGFTSPPYAVTFIDDSGHRIDLTGANTALFSWTLQNLTASTSHVGGGAWVITDAVNGEAEYYLTAGDVAVAGNCLVFVSIQLPSDSSPREFDPDPLMIEVGAGTTSPAPIPIVQVSGYIAPTYLVGSDGVHKASVSSSGALAVTANAGTNLNTSTLALESGGNLASIKSDADSIVTNTTGLATQTTLAAAKSDLDTIVTNTGSTVTNTTNINTHLATIDTNTASSKTDLDSIVTNTSHIPTVGQKAMVGSLPVTLASDQSTLPTSIASLPLPSGAATSAKQPALGAAGTASTDVLTVQGIAAMTPLKTDGSGVTQPVSLPGGAVTANAGTNLNTSTLALESGGNLAAIKSDADSISTNTSNTATNTTNINTAIGTPADSAYAGSGSTTNIGGLKGLYTKLSNVVLAAGSALIGGVNIVDSGGTNKQSVNSSGAANVNMTQVSGSIVTPLTLGQNTRSNSLPVTLASDQTDIPIRGDYLEIGSPGVPLTVNTTGNDLLISTDVNLYRSFSVQITGTWTGTLTAQGCNDNASWQTIDIVTMDPRNIAWGQVITTNGLYYAGLPCRYFRIHGTTISSGTANGLVELYTHPPFPSTSLISALQLGTWTIQPGNTQNTTGWVTQRGRLNATVAAGGGTANQVIKASSGSLETIIVTATGSVDLIFYDNASTNSGTIIGYIPASATLGQAFYGLPATSGIVAAKASGTPAVSVGYS